MGDNKDRIEKLENRLTDLEIAVGQGYVDMITGLEELKDEIVQTKKVLINSKPNVGRN